jgi:hypothetical protein
MGEEAEAPQPVIHGDHDNPAFCKVGRTIFDQVATGPYDKGAAMNGH